MGRYNVRIRETLEKIVTVEAKSVEEARAMVEESWRNSEYILDASDFKGAKIETLYPYYRDNAR